jgi:WD40 repeat protein
LIPALTQTPSPTHTPTATVTPYPTLSTQKPYLMIQQGKQVFYEYDADGLGRKVIELPPDGHIPGINSTLERIVSPDGKWLAFYTGSFAHTNKSANLPITLKLLNISNGTVINIAEIVTDDYIEKLGQLAENLKELYPDEYQPVDNHDWISGSVQSEFEWSIHSLDWSPDSRTLAFAAQIDGISSDVYLYDLETDSIQQIENSIQNVSSIRWSPDGQYLVFMNSEPGQIYTGSSLYAVKPSNQVVDNPKQIFSRTWMGGGHWLSPNLLLVADGTDTAGNFNLQTLDIRTGQLKPLWTDAVSDYAIDPLNKIIAINTGEFAELESMGVYFITFSGRQTKVLNGLYWATLFFRGGEQHRFLMQGVSEKSIESSFPISGDVIGLGLDGKPTSIGQFAYDKITISPDNSWLLMFDDTSLNIYDKNDNLAQKLSTNGIQKIIWRPDSQAIFYSDSKALYFLAIPSGEPRLVDDCERSSCSLDDIVWLP